MDYLFFDLDDTIYDRGAAFVSACSRYFSSMECDAYGAYLACNRRGNEVFHASQRGEISMDEMYVYRYCRGFEDLGVILSAEQALQFQKIYRGCQHEIRCTETMLHILEKCSEQCCLGLLTNGPSDKQRGKIETLGIEKYFDPSLILVSGEIGLDKPDPEIFRLAERKCGIPPEKMTYIGDSFSMDILPAAACGWKTVWFNRRKVSPTSLLPAMCRVIDSEDKLGEILCFS